ncbi:(Fe-S)-binding protein [Halalkalibacterium ligniniphilum]|uniref:(Fe-S)-binding protein n=1 Tax=Halalkalibacterium ligniniphilum TaxID=1134413 RepID=UPI0003489BB3|nr:(Fe-S)-binding protein [Halalkalibacterium ligniniphilum]
MKVSLFITCLADVFYPRVGKDTVEILERIGCEVVFPENQTCCGQPAYNSGYHKEAKNVAKHMIQVFDQSDYVVSPSGSCVAMIQEYVHLFSSDEKEWKARAKALSEKTFELTQFLVDVLKIEDVGAALTKNATYHTSCHMTRLLGVKDAPMKLLKNVKGLQVTNLPNKETCCGFGGTFSVKMVPISEQLVNEKIAHIEETEAEVLIGADCGCLMNIGGRIDRLGKPINVMHIAQVLNSKEG